MPTCSRRSQAGTLGFVRWLSPRFLCALHAILMMGAELGCGRFGFDEVSGRRSRASDVPVPGLDGSVGDGALGSDPVDGSIRATEGGTLDPEDAGLSDDAGPGTPAVRNCVMAQGSLACSDFDRTLPSNMFVEVANGTVSFDEDYIDAQTTAPGGWARVRATFAAVTSGTVYMRMSMFIPATSELSLLNFAELVEKDAPSSGVDFNFRGEDLEVYSHQTLDPYLCSGCMPPRDRWFCFRARVDLGDGDGRVRTWIEGTLLHDIQGADTLSPGGMQEAAFGIAWTDPSQGPTHLIIDDFAVSTLPLTGCP